MKRFKVLLALGLTLGGALFSGCTTKTDRDTSVPWGRPASWEGGIPGMGSPDQDRR